MGKYKSDYLALQNSWYVCVLRYLGSMDKTSRICVVDDFRDSLIDIKPEGVKAIRSNYDRWESDEWIPFCKKKLMEWVRGNPFESRIEENKMQEFENIKMDYNFLRYRKIMQLIQDSGIGLGQGKEIRTIDRKGYQDGSGL